jgi:hypothetical protein
VHVGTFLLRVEETHGPRVTRLRLTRTDPKPSPPPDDDSRRTL